MTTSRVSTLFKSLYDRFQDDEVPALSAQMTYYVILSFFPFLIFLLTLTAYTPFNREQLAADLIGIFPESSRELVQSIIEELTRGGSGALLSFGMIAAVWAASNGMMAVIRTLNKAYEEKEQRSWLKVRFISVLYTIGFTVAIWFAFALLVFGHLLGQWAFKALALPADFEKWWSFLKYSLSLVIMVVIFALLYYSAPSRRMKLKDAIPGAIFATVGWAGVSLLFSIYVNHFDSYTKAYGSLGGVFGLLIWLYVCSIILLTGGELNATLTFMREGKTKRDVP